MLHDERTGALGPMSFVDELRAAVGDRAVVTDPDVLVGYHHDRAGLVRAGIPLAAVHPRSTAEVADVVALAARHGVPIVPRGAGSGLAGGANAVDGGVVLSLTAMDAIVAIDTDDLTATVQPGVLNVTLSQAVREAGLWYPPDPASWEISTIGGNLATNAGGLCCVKYGVTRDAVLGLEVVLADGTVTRVGRTTVKGVAGYDLVGLLVGSEGTLGIITEATLRLRPSPPPSVTLVATFPSLARAGDAISATVRATSPSLLELLDNTTIRAIERWKRMDLDLEAEALLVAQSDLAGQQGRQEIATIERICRETGADLVVTTDDPEESVLLLAARRLAYPALEQLGTTLLDDVAVPRSAVTRMVGEVARIAERHGVLIGTFGHAGDGNLHPTIVYDATDPAQVAAAAAAFDDLVAAALELGGTVTGEHGIGLLKRDHLATELGPVALRLHRAVKDAFDPANLLNPGKVL
jgi:glycolate oxidase